MNDAPRLLPIRGMAARLFVTVKWLREEADAGRIPCVRAGRAYLFDAETVERVLLRRAEEGAGREAARLAEPRANARPATAGLAGWWSGQAKPRRRRKGERRG